MLLCLPFVQGGLSFFSFSFGETDCFGEEIEGLTRASDLFLLRSPTEPQPQAIFSSACQINYCVDLLFSLCHEWCNALRMNMTPS